MNNEELANLIVGYIDWWELPHNNYEDNYKETLKSLESKKETQAIYDYLYNEDQNDNKTYCKIMHELEIRLFY